ncbi:unnamed protein product [Ambrosiozyma monospora]|uniref:Unnamed protein product n=1 Tax=Ambrosiozyma monospora TaxID=43982 RepID=A0A9W6SX75_AMBMO|nr:unnamed protein product [Ambrosiozyma monospora]
MSDRFKGCTNFPQFLLNFYKIFIMKVKQLLVLDGSEDLVKEVYRQFVESFNYVIEGQLKTVVLKNQEDEKKKDFYLLATLSNLSCLKLKIIPRVLTTFDNNFGSKLATSNLPLYSKLETTEQKIYDEYLKDYKAQLTSILGNGIRKADWFHVKLPQNVNQIIVSSFVLQSLNLINLLKAKLLGLKCNKTYILKIEIALINYLIEKLIDFLKEIKQFSSSGLLKITIDLRFLVRVFENFSKIESNKGLLRVDILNSVTNKFLKKNTSDIQFVESVVLENLRTNESQMDCILTN